MREGFGFQTGKAYLVFAGERAVVTDETLNVNGRELIFADFWRGAVPAGTKILLSKICTRTGEFTLPAARETIRQLGRPVS